MRSSVCVCGSRLVAAHRRYSGLHEMRGPRGPRGSEPRHVCRGAAARKGATMDSLGDGLKDRGEDSPLAAPEDEGSLLHHTHRVFRFYGGIQWRLEREGVESGLGSPRAVRKEPGQHIYKFIQGSGGGGDGGGLHMRSSDCEIGRAHV